MSDHEGCSAASATRCTGQGMHEKGRSEEGRLRNDRMQRRHEMQRPFSGCMRNERSEGGYGCMIVIEHNSRWLEERHGERRLTIAGLDTVRSMNAVTGTTPMTNTSCIMACVVAVTSTAIDAYAWIRAPKTSTGSFMTCAVAVATTAMGASAWVCVSVRDALAAPLRVCLL